MATYVCGCELGMIKKIIGQTLKGDSAELCGDCLNKVIWGNNC